MSHRQFKCLYQNLSKILSLIEEGPNGCYSFEEITNVSDIIPTCLPTVDTCRDLFLGEEGIINYTNSNQILVDHSTVVMKTSHDCSNIATKNYSLLRCSSSGGPTGAADGNLTIMVVDDDHSGRPEYLFYPPRPR